MSQKYILDEARKPVPVTFDEWLEKFDENMRVVKQERIGGTKVSTIFLGLDHQFGGGRPLLFETMIFGGDHDGFQERCSTWDQAEEMHERAAFRVRSTAR